MLLQELFGLLDWVDSLWLARRALREWLGIVQSSFGVLVCVGSAMLSLSKAYVWF